MMDKRRFTLNRREASRSLFLGSMMFPALVSDLLAAAGSGPENPLAPKAPHFAGPAKRVIFIYLCGGFSHVDTFDPKPKLAEFQRDNKTGPNGRKPLGSPWGAQPRGNCGMEITDLFPNIGQCADDICLVRSLNGDANDHFQATLGIHTGSIAFQRPSVGSWVTYGLGTENQNLPAYVVLAPEMPYAGSQVWSSNFLPGVFSGTRIASGAEPVPDLNRLPVTPELQKMELGLLERFNRKHQSQHPGDPILEAQIKSYETAFGMQMTMPKVLDFSKETDATLKLYGLQPAQTTGFGWQCLAARRLIENGVRFVELIDIGADQSKNWDSHQNVQKTHGANALNVDRPIYGLIQDLKSRGLLKDTLVVCTTEFGRTFSSENGAGRGHFNRAYSSWLAGGGFKSGFVYGATDEFGASITQDPVHVHDFHATILWALGFDHTKLTFRHAGRDYRLTDVAGKVVRDLLV